MNVYKLHDSTYVVAPSASAVECWALETCGQFSQVSLVQSDVLILTDQVPDTLPLKFKAYCRFAGAREEQVRGYSRLPRLVNQRRAVAHCLREDGYSLGEIAFSINRDSSTVVSLLKKTNDFVSQVLQMREDSLSVAVHEA